MTTVALGCNYKSVKHGLKWMSVSMSATVSTLIDAACAPVASATTLHPRQVILDCESNKFSHAALPCKDELFPDLESPYDSFTSCFLRNARVRSSAWQQIMHTQVMNNIIFSRGALVQHKSWTIFWEDVQPERGTHKH